MRKHQFIFILFFLIIYSESFAQQSVVLGIETFNKISVEEKEKNRLNTQNTSTLWNFFSNIVNMTVIDNGFEKNYLVKSYNFDSNTGIYLFTVKDSNSIEYQIAYNKTEKLVMVIKTPDNTSFMCHN